MVLPLSALVTIASCSFSFLCIHCIIFASGCVLGRGSVSAVILCVRLLTFYKRLFHWLVVV